MKERMDDRHNVFCHKSQCAQGGGSKSNQGWGLDGRERILKE